MASLNTELGDVDNGIEGSRRVSSSTSLYPSTNEETEECTTGHVITGSEMDQSSDISEQSLIWSSHFISLGFIV